MRKFFALTLLSYLLAFSMPFVATAADETTETTSTESSTEEETTTTKVNCNLTGTDEEKAACTAKNEIDYVCNSDYVFKYNTSTEEDEQEAKEAAAEIDALYGEKLSEAYDENKCGQPNTVSGFLEKGDCSAGGKVITEITEVIAPDVFLDEDKDGDGEPDNEIITVYAGLCCMGYEVDDNNAFEYCDDVRTVYTETYEGCDSGKEGKGYAMDVGPYGNQGKEGLYGCEKRQWIIGSSGIGIVKLMVKQIFTFGALAVGSIAVSTIVFQGIKISVSGVSGDITESKNKILQAIAGIVLLFLSGLILYAINPTFFG